MLSCPIMKLRGCSNSHFIQAIRAGLVIKIHNSDSRGRPGLVIKSLEDIFRALDEGSGVDSERVKTEIPFLPLVERKTRESGEGCEIHEESLGEMTLKQLKERCKTKKRKASESALLMPKPEYIKPEDDDFDLKQPLSSWKLKLSKSPKSKKKRVKKTLSTSFERITDNYGTLQSSSNVSATITVKAEAPEPEFFTCKDTTCAAVNSTVCNGQVNYCGVEPGKNFETINCELNSMEPLSFTKQNESCVLDEVSFDHLTHAEGTSPPPPVEGENVDFNNQEEMGQQYLVLPVSVFKGEGYINDPPSKLSFLEIVSLAKNQIPNTCDTSQSCPDPLEMSEQVNHEAIEVSDLEIDNDLCSIETSHVGDSLMIEGDEEVLPQNQGYNSPSTEDGNFLLTWKSNSCHSLDEQMISVENDSPTEEKPPLKLTSAEAERGSSNPVVVLEDISPIHEEKQIVNSVTASVERNVSSHSHPYDVTSEQSTSGVRNYHCIELHQTPERLPSTRKVISPTSREKLCLAMNSAELFDDIDQYKCKETLYFGTKAEKKSSSGGSDIEGNDLSINLNESGQFPTKVTISPKQILKKSKSDKKGSPPKKGYPTKGCLEGPRLCHSLPRLSTGCTSIEACSESAVAFSQRQMHDIEALALKLMTELKSMKDIVEEKLLYEAYRSASLKNDADEVKSAIKTATKAEDTAKKWLSIMARDCNRFCKIMRLTELHNASASEETIHDKSLRREKKISFADEAGGKLCDVKLFPDRLDLASSEPISEKQVSEAN